jgi:phage-related protein
LFSAVKQGFTTIINALKPLITTIINTAKQIMTALQPVIDFIVNLVVNYVKFYINMVITYINIVVAVIKGIIGVITWVVNNIIAGVKRVIDFAKSVPTKVRNFVNKIVNFFREMPGKMLSIGLNVVKGIGNGITNGIGWIKNKIKSFVGNVTSFIKKIFKIGSPSRLMEDQVGQWIPKGIAVGIDANTDSVYSAMKNMQEDISSSFGLNPQLIGSSALNYSPNVIVNNNVNMSQDPLGRMVGDIKTFANGAKNDYNYGMGV